MPGRHGLTPRKKLAGVCAAALIAFGVGMGATVSMAANGNANEQEKLQTSSASPVFINDSTPGKLTVAKTVNDTADTTTNFTYKIVLNTPDESSLLNNWTYTSLTDKTLTGTVTVADIEPGDTVSATIGTDGTLTASGTNLSYEWHKVSEDGSDDVVGDDSNSYATQSGDDGCSFYCVVRDSSGTYTGWVKSNEAKCKKANKVKYAVQLYGINADKDAKGNVLDLTFGPALGASYASSYKACANKTSGCIHTDSWGTIIKHVKDGDAANVYAACLTNGCTKTVELSLNDTIGSGTYQQASGDGYGALSACIKDDYRRWNGTSSSSSGNEGGWAASWIRRTLNGSDNCKDTDLNISVTQPNSNTSLTSSRALISCFPSELQQAIKAKAVNTRTTYNDSNSVSTTYDKLWLLSYSEMGSTNDSGSSYVSMGEGSQYAKFSNNSITDFCSYSKRTTKVIAYVDTTSSADGTANVWWLRSSSARAGGSYALYVGSFGDVGDYGYTYGAWALAPGFCLG